MVYSRSPYILSRFAFVLESKSTSVDVVQSPLINGLYMKNYTMLFCSANIRAGRKSFRRP